FNSSTTWGNQLTHYSYIIPTINNTFPINNAQLQMVTAFSPFISNLIDKLKVKVPFGIYNETNSTIYLSKPRATSYGTIYGSKTYMLPSYTMNATSTVYYSPYNVEYSFFAYDQLIMFKVNMTSNLNITPLYIQPLYPPFNFRYVPNAPNGQFTIRWLLSVPPQDSNWTFNYYIYRYNSMEGFTTNPFNTSIGPYASFVNLLTFPPANYAQSNQSKTYIFNYTSRLGIGLNSSITIAKGTAYGGKVSYIQDSTTPSFSQGIGYCSSIFNETKPTNIVNQSGYYTMVSGALKPLGGPALPILYTAPCYIGTYIRGNNITIVCNQSLINDTGEGIVINDSKNVNLFYCDVKGNGIYIHNSTNVSISNTRVMPGLVNSTGISVSSSSNVKFVNFGVYNGFSIPFNETGSSNIAFYNLSSTNMSTIYYIENRTVVNGAFVLSNSSIVTKATSPSKQQQPSSFKFSQRDYLYIGALIVLAAYIYLFFKIQYKPSAHRHRTKRAGARSGRSRRSGRKSAKLKRGK
ncbi:MAG: right-handed parallel beta-helix repeat-containing protein, partial [Candidatus Micrarchaeaceae archaeon]